MQRWDTAHCNEDLEVNQHTGAISPKSDGSVWRTAVCARPVRSKGYVDFVIDRNPKPQNRGIQIGVVTRADLEHIKEAGQNFTNFKTGFSWSCNGYVQSYFVCFCDSVSSFFFSILFAAVSSVEFLDFRSLLSRTWLGSTTTLLVSL